MADQQLPNQGFSYQQQQGFSLGGGWGGTLATTLAQYGLAQIGGPQGYLPGPMQPTMNVYDQQRSMAFQNAQQQAMLQAGSLDAAAVAKVIQGGSTMAGGKQWSTEQQKLATGAGEMINDVTSRLAMNNPNFVNSLYAQGSASVMAKGVTSGLRYTPGGDVNQGGEFTKSLYGQLYGPDSAGKADMNGFDAGKSGEMFDEMARRGQMNTKDPKEAAKKLQEMSKSLSAVRDLLGANGDPDAPIPKLFKVLDDITNGTSGTQSSGSTEMLVRKVSALAQSVPGGLAKLSQLNQYGSQLAEAGGMDQSFGLRFAASSLAFSKAYMSAGDQGFGGLNNSQATMLDERLRAGATNSSQANAFGMVVSMSKQGLLHGQASQALAAALMEKDPAKKTALMAQYSNMRQGDIVNMLHGEGNEGSSINSALGDKLSNQQSIQEYGIGDVVRSMQSEGDVAGFVRNNLAGGMMGGFAAAGFGQNELSSLLPAASEAIRRLFQKLASTDPDILADPSKRLDAAEAEVAKVLGPQARRLPRGKLREIVASAIAGLQGAMGRSKTFGAFKNIPGLFGENSNRQFGAAAQVSADAEAEAAQTSTHSGIGQQGPVQAGAGGVMGAGKDTRIFDIVSKVVGAKNARELIEAEKAAGAAGKEGPLEITGTLRMLDDGTVKINIPDKAGSAPGT